MLNKRKSNFAELVWTSAAVVGNNAPAVADRIIREAFPLTISEAEIEGAATMLRVGVIAAVKDVLKNGAVSDDTIDFSEIDPAFGKIARRLKSKTYFVEMRNEYVSVAGLIRDPALLDDARRFMRRKGEECLAEAKNLDELYAAVTESSKTGEAA